MTTQKSVAKLLTDIERLDSEVAQFKEIIRTFNFLDVLKRLTNVEEK
jgi:hypothetical protein